MTNVEIINRLAGPNGALVKAIDKGDAEAVRKALADGANPNIYLQSRMTFALSRAADVWAGKKDTQSFEVVEALLDAGADPFAVVKVGIHSYYAISRTHLRSHPAVIRALEGKEQAWADGLPAEGKEFQTLLESLSGNGELEGRLLHALMNRASTRTPEGRDPWWREAMEERSGTLMAHCLTHFKPEHAPTGQWMRNYLAEGNNIQTANGLLAWLSTLSPSQQALELLGEGKEPGLLLLILKRIDSVGAKVWKYALDDAQVMTEMKRRGLMAGFLVLSMKADVKQAGRLLKMAVDEGLNVAEVTFDDVRSVDPTQSAWDISWAMNDVAKRFVPKQDASLLEVHLRRNDQEVSISLCRQLIKAGIKPDFGALEALCSKMTYQAKDRAYLKLFDEWTKAGVDPMPDDKPPVWTQLPNQRAAAIAALEARCVQQRMERNLTNPNPQAPRLGRSRM